MQTLTHMVRIKCKKDQSIEENLNKKNISLEQAIFIFEGWPKLEGEQND